MRFRRNIFLPFLALAMLISILGLINPPFRYFDRAFMHGVELRSQIQDLKIHLYENGTGNTQDEESLEQELTKIDSRLNLILDVTRKRHYGYSSLRCHIVAFAVLLLGFIVSILFSWRDDVRRLSYKTKNTQSNQTNKNG